MTNFLDPLFGVRTLKEIEEENRTLKNENFNLKMKIFFFEEALSSKKKDKVGDAVSELVELKSENESLKIDLDNSTTTCREALEVIDRLHNENKFLVDELNQSKEEYEKSFNQSQEVIDRMDSSTLTDENLRSENIEKTFEMEEEMASLKEHSKELKVENEELEEEREKLAKKIRDLLKENSELKNELEKSKGLLQKLEQKYNQMRKSLIDNKTEKIYQLTSEIDFQKNMNTQVQEQCEKLTKENKEYQNLLLEQSELIKKLNVRALYLIMFSSLIVCILVIIWILWDLKTVENKNGALKFLESSLEKMKLNDGQDDSEKSDLSSLSNHSSDTFIVKKSKKFLNLPRIGKKMDECPGIDPKVEPTDAGEKSKSKSPKLKNFLWNPLFGEEYAKKYSK